VKSYNSNERLFKNEFSLVRTFTKRLNQKAMLAAKEKIMKHQLFVKVMQRNGIEEVKKKEVKDNEHFYRKATRDGK